MARLRYIGEGSYRGHGPAWPNGEVREVDEAEAAFIRRHVPDLFEDADAPKADEEAPAERSRTKPAAVKKK